MKFVKDHHEIDLVDYANKNILIAEEEQDYYKKRKFVNDCIREVKKVNLSRREFPSGLLDDLKKCGEITLNSWLYYSGLVSKLNEEIDEDARGRQKFLEYFCKTRDEFYDKFVKITQIATRLDRNNY